MSPRVVNAGPTLWPGDFRPRGLTGMPDIDINEPMRNIEDQLRQAANKDGRSILALSRDAEIGYQSIWAFVRGRGSLNLGSASRLAAALGLELRPIIERKGR